MTEYKLQPGQKILSNSNRYFVEEIIGTSCFGKVARCQNLVTKEKVAVKIARDNARIVEARGLLNMKQSNVLMIHEMFSHHKLKLIVFDSLDKSLTDMIHTFRTMSLINIRCIAKQLLEALVQLKYLGIIHTDINPDNVVVVDLNDKLLRVKLKDPDNALPIKEVENGMIVQPVGYRAPEVSLGLPFNETIDIWGFGCLLAFLYISDNLFPNSQYHMMKQIVKVRNQPEDHLLNAGSYTDRYFIRKTSDGPTWRLRTPEEFTARNNIPVVENPHCYNDQVNDLESLLHLRFCLTKEDAEFEDRYEFVELLQQLLRVDGGKRITAHGALQQPFITMEHMTKHKDSIYVALSKANMCRPQKTDSSSSHTSSHEPSALTAYELQPGQTILSTFCGYTVEEIVGSTFFGKVARCRDQKTKERVAVKIIGLKNVPYEVEWARIVEGASLLKLSERNVVMIHEMFSHHKLKLMVFDSLDRSLTDMIHTFRTMSLINIRCIAKQLLEALVQLKYLGIIHTDINPDNVVVVDLNDKLLRVKLKDPDNALPIKEVDLGMIVQPVGYRAPEVSLGLPFNETIDIWGFGCLLAFLYISDNLFPNSQYHMMKHIVEVLGQPEDHLLNAGSYTDRYFIRKTSDGPTWRLRTPEEFTAINNIPVVGNPHCYNDQVTDLESLFYLRFCLTKEDAEFEDQYEFVELLEQLLRVDGRKRITAHGALQQPFITMEHMTKHKDSIYVALSKANMCGPQKTESSSSHTSGQKSSELSLPTFAQTAIDMQPGQTLFSSSASYRVEEIIGCGFFGKVARCQNLETKEKVAVKMFGRRGDAEQELKMLEAISVLNPDKSNIVKFFEWFEYKHHIYLVFECLDKDLLVLIESNHTMSLVHIRCIAKQLLEALAQLKDVGILHRDIKADNVAVVDLNDTCLRVKLLDFGVAQPVADVELGDIVQLIGNRAPEVSLGLPVNEAIDIWGFGCLLAFLYMGSYLFPHCEYHKMKQIVKVLGQPEDHLLNSGLYTDRYFIKEAADGRTWRLRTPEEYAAHNNVKLTNMGIGSISCLDDLHNLRLFLTKEDAEFEDRYEFVDFMKQLLRVDGEERITARQALQHPFITMEHMTKHKDSIYVALSKANMDSSPSHTSGQDYSGLCDGDPVTSPNDKDLKVCRSDGESPPVIEDEVPKESLSRTRMMLKILCRFFRRIGNFFHRCKCPRA